MLEAAVEREARRRRGRSGLSRGVVLKDRKGRMVRRRRGLWVGGNSKVKGGKEIDLCFSAADFGLPILRVSSKLEIIVSKLPS